MLSLICSEEVLSLISCEEVLNLISCEEVLSLICSELNLFWGGAKLNPFWGGAKLNLFWGSAKLNLFWGGAKLNLFWGGAKHNVFWGGAKLNLFWGDAKFNLFRGSVKLNLFWSKINQNLLLQNPITSEVVLNLNQTEIVRDFVLHCVNYDYWQWRQCTLYTAAAYLYTVAALCVQLVWHEINPLCARLYTGHQPAITLLITVCHYQVINQLQCDSCCCQHSEQLSHRNNADWPQSVAPSDWYYQVPSGYWGIWKGYSVLKSSIRVMDHAYGGWGSDMDCISLFLPRFPKLPGPFE